MVPVRRLWPERDGQGIGPANESIARLFRPFERLDRETDARFEGTGLGLALVKGLVELHGGRVTLASQLNKGTIVSVAFPQWRLYELRGEGAGYLGGFVELAARPFLL